MGRETHGTWRRPRWTGFGLGALSATGWLALLLTFTNQPWMPWDAWWLRVALVLAVPIVSVLVSAIRGRGTHLWWRTCLTLVAVVVGTLPAIVPWLLPGNHAISLLLLPLYTPGLALGVAVGFAFADLPVSSGGASPRAQVAFAAGLGFAAPIATAIIVGIIGISVSPPTCATPEPHSHLGPCLVALAYAIFVVAGFMLALSALVGFFALLLGSWAGAWLRRRGAGKAER